MRHQDVRASFTTSQASATGRVFADRLVSCTVTSGTARLDFCETRVLMQNGGKPPRTVEVPVASIAIPVSGLFEMHRSLGEILAALAADQAVPSGQPN